MATFSTNQVRQLYVALSNSTDTLAKTKVPKQVASDVAAASAGNIGMVSADGGKTLYFSYKGAGGQTRSDIIKVENITAAKLSVAGSMAQKPQRVILAADTTVAAAPVAGQDYIVRIAFRQYVGMSEEDQYFKYGVAHATAAMTTYSQLYVVLAMSLFKNMSREISPLVDIYLTTGTATTQITSTTKTADLTDTYTGIVIQSAEQEWKLGTMSNEYIPFTVQPTTIDVNSDTAIWGTVTKDTVPAASIKPNSKKIADMEYFYMGERGDIYRYVGFPNSIKTTYLVDPTYDKGYSVLDIHYSHIGDGEYPQKSEKDITIVSKLSSNEATAPTIVNTLAGYLANYTTVKQVAADGTVTDVAKVTA